MAHRIQPETAPLKRPRQTPTQVLRPWRSTLRTVVIAAIALLPALPEIATATDLETVPVVASLLTITAAIQRVITLPSVDAWLGRFLSLGASDRKEYVNNGPYFRNSDET